MKIVAVDPSLQFSGGSCVETELPTMTHGLVELLNA